MPELKELFTDEELLQRLALDDEQAMEILFKRYYSQLVRFAKGIVREKAQAEDLVQELFLKLWNKKNTLQLTSGLKSYLFVATRNLCLNQIKQNERKYWMEDDMENDERFAVNDIEHQLGAKTLEQKIRSVVDQLPPKCSLIFKMSRFEQKSHKEIAEALQLSVKTVENQVGKALQVLRTGLAEHLVSITALLYLWF